ncbi:hypothetical protein Ahy_A02g007260 isoform A [Arachis hypogaea]|uniref:Uncharacterized protein n=1 Tax=Arachis hypogaea TaxID=3818 RepID=A0A445ECF1_ARAHY|nr:hypothetical protein Ahy_A02g007260 isoform A [Arachis hypogaea]
MIRLEVVKIIASLFVLRLRENPIVGQSLNLGKESGPRKTKSYDTLEIPNTLHTIAHSLFASEERGALESQGSLLLTNTASLLVSIADFEAKLKI